MQRIGRNYLRADPSTAFMVLARFANPLPDTRAYALVSNVIFF